MKIAISSPDGVFALAERSVERLGISESQSFARAAKGLGRHVETADITERIDAVLAKTGNELDPELARIQAKVLTDAGW